MIIDQLPLLSTDVQGTDEIPIERGTSTYKTTQAALVRSAEEKSLPSGGSAGQILAKIDGTNYNTQWINPPDPSGFVSYAQAQTLTDAQQAQARNNISASEKWTLLWQNASPTSIFGPQTITLSEDSHNYDFLAFVIRNVGGVQFVDSTFFDGAESGLNEVGYVSANNVATRGRIMYITNASVDFRDNRQSTISGTSPTQAITVRNDINQPVAIYGVNI